MKKVFFISMVVFFLVLTISTVNAQFIADYCTVSDVPMKNTVENGINHVELDYVFTCSNAATSGGQLTKFLFTVQYPDVQSLKAEDSFGVLKSLEGPAYVGVTSDDSYSTAGVIFRKGLLIENNATNSYSVKVSFDVPSSVVSEVTDKKTTYKLKPAGLMSDPRVTIVTTGGVTETSLAVPKIDYELELEDGAEIDQIKPAFCTFSDNVITCDDLTPSGLTQVEIKWTGKGLTDDISGQIQGYTKKYLPDFTSFIFRLFGSFRNLLSSTGITE